MMLRTLMQKILRAPRGNRARDLKTVFVPVIFANNFDDDLPGLVAALRNEPVHFAWHIYSPGENIRIEDRMLCLSCNLLFVLGAEDVAPPDASRPGTVVVRQPANPRHITIWNCIIRMNRSTPGHEADQ